MNPTTIKSGNTHLQLTGEIRPVQTGEWYWDVDEPSLWNLPEPTSGEYPILREVEPPKPLPVEYPESDCIYPLRASIEGEGDLALYSDNQYVHVARDDAIDLARRILEHFGVSE